MTGLVVGSMVPDFEYFLRLKVKSIYSHTWQGLFWFDLPLALIICFVFQAFVRKDLLANLPTYLHQRLNSPASPKITFASFTVLMLSVLIGASSHLAWDGFTHADGIVVQMWPVLSKSYNIGGYLIPGYKMAQHLSTVLGTVLIVWAIAAQTPAVVVRQRVPGYWLGVLCTISVLVVIKIMFAHKVSPGDLVVTVISGFLLGIVVAPALHRIVRNRRQQPGRNPQVKR